MTKDRLQLPNPDLLRQAIAIEQTLDEAAQRYEAHADTCWFCERGLDCWTANSLVRKINALERRLG